ncbi:MAG: ParB/RepB/Spo0J family partition protein [Clostridia bacterium]|nr:ParB/RepB/Spo0J family partition protein [Clostridia bacterium]
MFSREKKENPITGIPPYAPENDGILRFGRLRGQIAGEIRKIAPERIAPNPHQPRRFFAPDELAALSDSIRLHGIIQPLTVRALEDGRYELIAGERRLRAAMLLKLESVPCVIMDVDERQSAAMAIIENLQRRDLNMFEQASAIASLIELCCLTQEDVAGQLSVSQSFVANKLRLLRFSAEEREKILSAPLTERHARTLLRIPEPQRAQAIDTVIARHWNVADTEAYVDRLLASSEPASVAAPARESNRAVLNRDVRLFCNSVNNALDIMRRAGVDAQTTRRETEEATEIWIRIPKKDCFT